MITLTVQKCLKLFNRFVSGDTTLFCTTYLRNANTLVTRKATKAKLVNVSPMSAKILSTLFKKKK